MTSRIEAGITVEGSIRGEGELEVAGRIRGALTLDGTLVVEPGGIVEADVEATRIRVAGMLSGSATAHESVQVMSGGRVEARVKAPRMLVDDGAVFRGELQAQTSMATAESGEVLEGRARAQLPGSPSVARRTKRNSRTPIEVPLRSVPEPEPAPTRAPSRAIPEPPPGVTLRGRTPSFALPPRDGVASAPPAVPAEAAPKVRATDVPRMPPLPRGRTLITRREG